MCAVFYNTKYITIKNNVTGSSRIYAHTLKHQQICTLKIAAVGLFFTHTCFVCKCTTDQRIKCANKSHIAHFLSRHQRMVDITEGGELIVARKQQQTLLLPSFSPVPYEICWNSCNVISRVAWQLASVNFGSSVGRVCSLQSVVGSSPTQGSSFFPRRNGPS